MNVKNAFKDTLCKTNNAFLPHVKVVNSEILKDTVLMETSQAVKNICRHPESARSANLITGWIPQQNNAQLNQYAHPTIVNINT